MVKRDIDNKNVNCPRLTKAQLLKQSLVGTEPSVDTIFYLFIYLFIYVSIYYLFYLLIYLFIYLHIQKADITVLSA